MKYNMPPPTLPPPTLTISKTHARRFLLAHQRLWPPRSFLGKSGIQEYIQHVGCIQFDPINVVGRNPDLVLQSRITAYRPGLLDELLYHDRTLCDGFDKVSSIYLTADRPYFARHRARMVQQHGDPTSQPMQIAPLVLQAIGERGPLSSTDIKHGSSLNWSWGQNSSLVRASMEVLYAMGQLGIHHRVHTRRYFDLIERLLPGEVLSAPDPNVSQEDYQNWHVLRRVGGLGLANSSAAEYWLGILGVKSQVRRETLWRLVESGRIAAVEVEENLGRTFFIRTADLPTLEASVDDSADKPRSAFLGPLDNLTWDRKLLRWIFDFDYIWEVYKPVAQRKYGYYVLPVLYGDEFVARFDPAFDKKTRRLTINNWWWEAGVNADENMQASLLECFREFTAYLDVKNVQLGDQVAGNHSLKWIKVLV